MMNPADEATAMVWALVLAVTAAFFVGAARKLCDRGLEFLGLAAGAAALAEFLFTASFHFDVGGFAFLLARGSIFIGIFALSLNLHFVFRYLEIHRFREALWLSYVLTGGASLASIALSVAQGGSLAAVKNRPQAFSLDDSFPLVLLVVLTLHYLAAVAVCFLAVRRRQKHAWVLLVALGVLSPLAIADATGALLLGQRLFIVEGGAWLYCLVVLGTIVSEYEGAEGRLKETASSLAERTAELEITYAEIELMSSELLSKQQLAAVGELAGSIAHEVRNPLAIIMNAVSGLKRSHVSETDKETLLSIVNEEAERLNHLVAELLRFARPVAASRGPASLLDLCEKVRDEAPEGVQIRVVKDEGRNLNPVLVDPGLFRLALDNLMANAAQAMGEGGVIELWVRQGSFLDGSEAAALDVKDTGCGMTPAERENAKKPFFTTKPRGTGLGIPIALRIVEAHGGELSIESGPGIGTTVSIKLPFDSPTHGPASYPGAKTPSTRRRMRTFSSGSVDPSGNQKQKLSES
jgi:signal transduction histidine kinase